MGLTTAQALTIYAAPGAPKNSDAVKVTDDGIYVTFTPPRSGSDGNQLISFAWVTKFEEVEKPDGDVVAKRVSDFSRAEPCVVCGRNVVYQYTVKSKNGEISLYGSEHLNIAMGTASYSTEQNIKKTIETAITEERNKQIQKEWADRAEKNLVHEFTQRVSTSDSLESAWEKFQRKIPLEHLRNPDLKTMHTVTVQNPQTQGYAIFPIKEYQDLMRNPTIADIRKELGLKISIGVPL